MKPCFFIFLAVTSLCLVGCATKSDFRELKNQQMKLRTDLTALANKQLRLVAQLTRVQAQLNRQQQIFKAFRKKGQYSVASIGENVSQLRSDHQKLLGTFYQLKEKFTKLMDQHQKLLKDYTTRFGDPLNKEKKATTIIIENVSPEKIFQGGKTLYVNKSYDDAIKRFKVFVNKYPSHQLADDALIYIGDCYFKKKNPAEASLWYTKVRKKYKSGDKVAEALLKLGKVYLLLGACGAGKTCLRRILRSHRSSPHAQEARRLLRNFRRLCRK